MTPADPLELAKRRNGPNDCARAGLPCTRLTLRLGALPILAMALSLTFSARASVARDWLDLRRSGVQAVLADARVMAAPVQWAATYSGRVPETHPWFKEGITTVRLSIARAPGLPKQPGRTLVRLEEPAQVRGWGVLIDGNKGWIRLGATVEVATPAKLAQPLPKLGLALGAFIAGDHVGAYELMIEGEFGDTAVLRLKPRYDASPDLLPVKAGVSKRWGAWTLGELDDRKGVPISRIEWLDLKEIGGVAVPSALRLLPGGDVKLALSLERVDLKMGASAPWVTGPRGLK